MNQTLDQFIYFSEELLSPPLLNYRIQLSLWNFVKVERNFFRWIKHGVSFMTDKLQQHQYNTGSIPGYVCIREHHGAQLSIKLPKWSLKRTQMAKKVPTEAQISKHWPTWIVEHMHLKHDVFAFFSPFSPIQSMHHWFQNDCGGDIESNGWPFCGIYPNPTKPRIPV